MADLSGGEVQANSDRWHAMGAGFLGWTLDAFDFLVVIFLLDTLAAYFHVSKRDIILTITAAGTFIIGLFPNCMINAANWSLGLVEGSQHMAALLR